MRRSRRLGEPFVQATRNGADCDAYGRCRFEAAQVPSVPSTENSTLMTSFSLKKTFVALATASLGLAGCSGDAPVESAEAESTGGGEAEASCGSESSCGGESGSGADAPSETEETTEAEASCGEGSCG